MQTVTDSIEVLNSTPIVTENMDYSEEADKAEDIENTEEDETEVYLLYSSPNVNELEKFVELKTQILFIYVLELWFVYPEGMYIPMVVVNLCMVYHTIGSTFTGTRICHVTVNDEQCRGCIYLIFRCALI